MTVLQEAIEDRRGDDAVAEDLAPAKPLFEVRTTLPRSSPSIEHRRGFGEPELLKA